MDETNAEASASMMPADSQENASFGLDILHVIKSAQSQHGLRHGDYQRYHGYCTRRIKRVRKVLGFKMGEKKKVTPKVITNAHVTDSRYLLLVVMASERCWSYAMHLKQLASEDVRKRHHMIQRLKKAAAQAKHLNQLCDESSSVDARTKLEAKAYSSYINGVFHFECQEWSEAMQLFDTAKTIYSKLCEAKTKEEGALYQQMIDDISPNIRYCAYNIGDESAMNDLLQLRSSRKQDVLLADKLDSLVIQVKEQKAMSMSEISWKSHKIPVKNNKVRIFLISLRTFEREITADEKSREEKLEMFEDIVNECKEALLCVRDDIKLDKNLKKAKITDLDLLYSYITYTCNLLTVRRNLLLAEELESKSPARFRVLTDRPSGILSTPKTPGTQLSTKKVKLSDFIRLYDIILANMLEISNLKGLADNKEVADAIFTQEQSFRALKCFFIAEAFGEQSKWKEAIALYEKVLSHAHQALERLPKLSPNCEEVFITTNQLDHLVEIIAFNKYHTHASAVMQASETKADSKSQDKKESAAVGFLADNLNHYYDSSEILKTVSGSDQKGGLKLTSHFPPSFVPAPNKPLFFDLALNHLSFPSLEDKVAPKAKAGGISGYIKSFWGWGGGK